MSRPRSGSTGRSFVVREGSRRLFVKFDVPVIALRRLADLRVTPPVLHQGNYRGRSFVIQPGVESRHPTRGWLEAHLGEVARIVRAYQGDLPLRELISPASIPTHNEHIEHVVSDLERRSRSGPRARSGEGRFGEATRQLRRQGRALQPAELVATHGDPNLKNFVLADCVYLVDWDDLAHSDPIRDVGQLLWWYVPINRWEHSFELFGLGGGDAVLDRLYWWVAAESLDVALRFAEGGHDEEADEFMRDFAAAIEQQPNPRSTEIGGAMCMRP